MKTYTIEYRPYNGAQVKSTYVAAWNKVEAYYKGFDKITEEEGEMPYSAWVSSVTYSNGNYRLFNTFEGMPY